MKEEREHDVKEKETQFAVVQPDEPDKKSNTCGDERVA
jgi:hypothetical protein